MARTKLQMDGETSTISVEELLEERRVSRKILRAINETALSLKLERGVMELTLRVPGMLLLLLFICATSGIGGVGLKMALKYLGHFH